MKRFTLSTPDTLHAELTQVAKDQEASLRDIVLQCLRAGLIPACAVNPTIHEQFTALAMQGLLSNPNIVSKGGTTSGELVQKMAVSYADNVLREFSKKAQGD